MITKLRLLIPTMLIGAQLTCAAVPVCYPVTPVGPVAECVHGVEIIDPYRWLEDASDCRVQSWTAAQNTLAKGYLSRIYLRDKVQKRLQTLDRYDYSTYDEVSNGQRRFVWIRKADQEQTVLAVQNGPSDSVHELINPNTWPQGQKLDFAIPSPDGSYVAYGVSLAGDERPIIKILKVDSHEVLSDTLKGTKQGWTGGNVSWLPHNEGFFFGTNPDVDEVAPSERDYWHAVYYHRIGTQACEDVKVFSHPTIREYFHHAIVSDDGRYLLLTRSTVGNGSELYLKSIDVADAPILPMVTGFEANYNAVFAGDKILIITDECASNGRVFVTDASQSQRDSWKELIPERADKLVDVQPIAGRLYVNYLHNAQTLLKVYDIDGIFLRDISLNGIGTAEVSGYWAKGPVWVDFSSFVQPHTRYQYDYTKNSLELVSATTIPLNPAQYEVRQVWYPSKDGTQISMFLISAKKDLGSGPRPTLLTGYGGFGVSITPAFTSIYLPFIEAGGLVAVANLRGGGEYGEEWHLAGSRANKQNVFDDFIGAAEWLIAKGYTKPSLLGIRGRSNGGLLVGAALTQRPDLFRAVLCEVPLLDMLRYHRFGFANCWCEEYGCVDNAEDFAVLLAYSPYHHVVEGIRYPAVLIRGAENDSRTDALHARKMAARLQAADSCGLPKLLLVDKEAGHLGGANLSSMIEQKAESLSFLMHELGMGERARIQEGN